MEQEYECIIIGAGAAGIGAAYTLQKQNFPYLILQARLRIGGRVQPFIIDGIGVDLGASWIHSYTQKNPFYNFINEYKIPQITQLPKRTTGRVYYDGQKGQYFSEQVMDYAHYNLTDYFQTVRSTAQKLQHDISLHEGAQDFYARKQHAMSMEEKRCTQLMINLTEHYEASSTKELSANHYQYHIDQGANYSPEGTYGGLLKRISENLNIELNKKVVCIEKTPQKIFIKCSDNTVYCCKKIIISLPLGVLKQKCVNFIPQLPIKYQTAINNLGFGLMNKIIMSFQENFWGEVFWINIGCNEKGRYPVFYNCSQKKKHLLCCFVTDDFARKIEGLPDNIIINQLISLLRKVFGQNKVKLREAKITRWGADQFSLGSYTAFHCGSTPDDSYQLREPIEDRMYFIGEHCYPEHIGTAHGAFQTGIWAAQQILQNKKWINPKWMEPMRLNM